MVIFCNFFYISTVPLQKWWDIPCTVHQKRYGQTKLWAQLFWLFRQVCTWLCVSWIICLIDVLSMWLYMTCEKCNKADTNPQTEHSVLPHQNETTWQSRRAFTHDGLPFSYSHFKSSNLWPSTSSYLGLNTSEICLKGYLLCLKLGGLHFWLVCVLMRGATFGLRQGCDMKGTDYKRRL